MKLEAKITLGIMLGLILGVYVVVQLETPIPPPPPVHIPLTKADIEWTPSKEAEYQKLLEVVTREEQVLSNFGADGHLKGMEELIKQAIVDPDSYKPISTKWTDGDDGIVIGHRYWAEDYLGMKYIGWVILTIDLEGTVLKVLNESPTR
jgi:hypothetical protein